MVKYRSSLEVVYHFVSRRSAGLNLTCNEEKSEIILVALSVELVFRSVFIVVGRKSREKNVAMVLPNALLYAPVYPFITMKMKTTTANMEVAYKRQKK